jgi:nitrate/nitrite transporter NarK
VFAYYFGRKHLGAIKGQVTTFGVAGSAFGPTLFSRGKDFFGNYEMTLLLCAVIPLVLALIAPFIKPPKRKLT